MAIEHPEMSDGAIAATIGIARQLVSRWRKPLRVAAATAASQKVADDNGETQSVAKDSSAPQPATSGNATTPERQRLLDLASDDQQLEVMIDKILRGSAPRAAAVSVGITSKQFSTRLENDLAFRDLVLRAAHQAEGGVAEALYTQAIGRSPQSVQAAIAWLEKRHPELWGREAQRIEIELTGAVDVNHILSDPRLIAEANRHEAMLQALEDGETVDAEFRELPAFDAPPLPDVVLDDCGPNPTRVNRAPGQRDPQQGMRPTRIIKVSGVDTLVGDEIGPSSDSDGGIRIVG
jgi:hypothetical protein